MKNRKVISLKEKDKAEKKGMAAFKKGEPLSACPYERDRGIQSASNMCRRLWIGGWFRQKLTKEGIRK